jgi:hypothetical protein
MKPLFYGNTGRMVLGPYTGTDLRAMAFGRRWLALPGNGGPNICALRARDYSQAQAKLNAHLARTERTPR